MLYRGLHRATVSHRDALRQEDVQSWATGKEGASSTAKPSRGTQAQAVQREPGIAGVVKLAGSRVSNARDQRG